MQTVPKASCPYSKRVSDSILSYTRATEQLTFHNEIPNQTAQLVSVFAIKINLYKESGLSWTTLSTNFPLPALVAAPHYLFLVQSSGRVSVSSCTAVWNYWSTSTVYWNPAQSKLAEHDTSKYWTAWGPSPSSLATTTLHFTIFDSAMNLWSHWIWIGLYSTLCAHHSLFWRWKQRGLRWVQLPQTWIQKWMWSREVR